MDDDKEVLYSISIFIWNVIKLKWTVFSSFLDDVEEEEVILQTFIAFLENFFIC